MSARTPRSVAFVIALAWIGVAGGVHAAPKPEDQVEAQRLFNDALADMKAGNYVEACPKLDRSQLLDPGMGTQFRLAECLEKSGKLVRSAALYQEVADAARSAGKNDRAKQAQDAADAVRPRVPAIVVHLSPEAAQIPGLEVFRDDVKLDAKALAERVPVDPGPHKVTVRAPGYTTFEQESKLHESEIAHVNVPVLTKVTAPPPPKVVLKPENAKVPIAVSIGLGALGLAGLGMGVGFGVRAAGKWDDAKNECIAGPTLLCNPKGVDDAHDASLSATLSTVGFVVGGVSIAAAIPALVIGMRRTAWNEAVARTQSATVIPLAGPGFAGVGAFGRF